MLKIPRLTKSIQTDFRNLTKNSRQPQLVAKVLTHSYAHAQYFASRARSLSPPLPPYNVVSPIAPSANDFAITMTGEGDGGFYRKLSCIMTWANIYYLGLAFDESL